jgi:hypothetical protein
MVLIATKVVHHDLLACPVDVKAPSSPAQQQIKSLLLSATVCDPFPCVGEIAPGTGWDLKLILETLNDAFNRTFNTDQYDLASEPTSERWIETRACLGKSAVKINEHLQIKFNCFEHSESHDT